MTGAGISKESGIPTFREAQVGLWAQYNPEELATPEAFQKNPALVWEWYTWRRALIANSNPNEGHLALVEMEAHIPYFTLITQNVDGLHKRAGSRNVLEIHGNIMRSKCFEENTFVREATQERARPPTCPTCGSYMRPDVVWFGEALPPNILTAAWEAAEQAEVFLSVGTSAIVQPVASLPGVSKRAGATLVEVNTEETPISHMATYQFRGPAGMILPELVAQTWPL